MKTASGTLQTFLFTKQAFVYADLYTFTLPGSVVLRWTSADIPITFGGHTWVVGPAISDGGVDQKLGLDVSTLEIEIRSDDRFTISGSAITTFARRNGFDGAIVLVERIFLPSWEDAAVGSVIRFSGRFSELTEASTSGIKMNVNSWTEVLDVNEPVDVFQASCLNTVYDAKCTLNKTSFKTDVTISPGFSLTELSTSYGGADGTMTLGFLTFTSGALNGIRRTIKDQTGGFLTLVQPLPALPSIGDTLSLFPGCDLKKATCLTKFANLVNFRGQPFIPVPEQAV